MNNFDTLLDDLETYIEPLEKDRKKLAIKVVWKILEIFIYTTFFILVVFFTAFGWLIPFIFLSFNINNEYLKLIPQKEYTSTHHFIKFISSSLYGVLCLSYPAVFFVPLGANFNIRKQLSILKKNYCKDYCEQFKNEVVKQIIKSINSKLNYSPNLHIQTNEFINSLLLSSNSILGKISITGDDLIEGKIKDTQIKLSEIQINNLYRDEDNKEHNEQFWQGLFMIIDLPKNTNTAFGTSNNISNNKILLDNTKFNEFFPVYAENTTEAFYVLPSNLLERMVNFVHKTGRKFDFSVVDDKFYIAIPYNRELLEPPIFKSLFDYSIYEEYLTDLELAIGIVEDLKLA